MKFTDMELEEELEQDMTRHQKRHNSSLISEKELLLY